MKDTKPPRETVSSLNYRDAEGTPTTTAPELASLAGAALALLARDGAAEGSKDADGRTTWHLATIQGDGLGLDIRCTGADLPKSIPGETAHPSLIPFERPWVGSYRLTVKAPLVVLDLYWRADAPLRIMGFSRGDWEPQLRSMAGAAAV